MIQVQIAGQLNRRSVQGVRWVLVEAGDSAARAPAPAVALADAATLAAEAPGQNPRALMTLWLLKGAVLLLGLLVAWWMSLALLGPPSRGLIRPPSARPSGQPVPAMSAPSGASQPLPPASKPVLTAGLAR